MKWVPRLLIGALFIIWALSFYNRYLAPSGGVPTSFDYNNHLMVSHHLQSGTVFPSLDQSQVGEHGVSKYLPIYHGLLGFHLIAAGLESLGMPLPGAYGFIMDLSLLAIFSAFILLVPWHRTMRWEFLLAVLLIFPCLYLYFAEAVDRGFFGQLLSQALILWAYYFWKRMKLWMTAFLMAYATICYPDFLIWTLPILGLPELRRLIPVIARPFVFAAWMVLAIVPLTRSHLMGPYVGSLFPFILETIFLILFSRELFHRNRHLLIATTVHVLYCLPFLILSSQHTNPGYYAVKLANFAYILVPLLLLEVPIIHLKRGLVFVIGGSVVLMTNNSLWSPYATRYFQPPAYNNRIYAEDLKSLGEIKLLKGTCSPQALLPVYPHDFPNFEQRFLIMSALTNNYDLYSGELKTPLRVADTSKLNVPPEMSLIISMFSHRSADEIASLLSELAPDQCLAIPKDYSRPFTESSSFETIMSGSNLVYVKTKGPQGP